MSSVMAELSRRDIEHAIRLLQAALRYSPEEELDTDDEDVLRWESEGGSPSHRL